MLGGVLAWLARGGLGGIANELRQAQKDRLDAANDAERLEAEKHIASIEARMEAQTRGEASWMPKLVRGLFAAPFVMPGTQAILIATVFPAIGNLALAYGLEWKSTQSIWKADE